MEQGMSSPVAPMSASAVPSEVMITPGNALGEGRGIPEAVDIYTAACNARRLKPNQYFLSLVRSCDSIVILDFRGPQYLSDGGVFAVSAALSKLPHLKVLSLADNGLSNDGIGVLCDSFDAHGTGLHVLDLHRNDKITRAGGQRLLNTVGRAPTLACINLTGTRVSNYFEVRIQRHVARHYQQMSEVQRGVVDSLVVALSWSADGRSCPSAPRFKANSVAAHCASRTYRNETYDEAVDASSNAGSNPDSVECLGDADLLVLNSGSYSITRHGNRRTIFSIATPTGLRVASPGSGVTFFAPGDIADLAELVEAYKPRVIELEPKFVYPGKIEYVAAAHAPDPMLSPAMPVPFADETAQSSVKPSGQDDAGMYWSFFTSAAAATSTTARGQAPTPTDEDLQRRYEWRQAADVICTNLKLLGRASSPAARPLPLAQMPLCRLLEDPSWDPNQPTRTAQVEQYLTRHKLKYNTVSGERFQVQPGMQREYILQRVIRHTITERLTAGALNARGNLLATSSYDMTCKLWSTETGKKLCVLAGHEGHISECMFNAPLCDKIVTASYDKTLKVWRVEDGELLHTLRGHDLEIVALAGSKDGTKCASGGMDDLAIVWDIEKGDEVCTLTGHVGEVVTLDFNPQGTLIVTGSMDETVRIWRIADGSCLHTLSGHTQEIGHVTFNCFGNIVLSSSIDGTCRLWDVGTGACKVLRGHSREVVDCCFSPSGWQCASVSDDHTVRIWDVITGGCVTMITGHTAGVCHAAFNSTGTEILTGSLDMTARLWNVETGECLQVLRGHRSVVLVGYSADSDRILTISKDNSCRIWRREPASNSLLHHAAVAICLHPTVYQEILQAGVVEHLKPILQRVHRKVFHTERDAVSTPLPVLDTPAPTEADERSPTPRHSASLVTSPVALGEDSVLYMATAD